MRARSLLALLVLGVAASAVAAAAAADADADAGPLKRLMAGVRRHARSLREKLAARGSKKVVEVEEEKPQLPKEDCLAPTSSSSSTNSSGGGGVVPIIDVGALVTPGASAEAKAETAASIGRACADIGFLVITNHGLDPEVVDAAWEATAAFFDQPIDAKMQAVTADEAEYPYGYSKLGGEDLAAGKAAETGDASASSGDAAANASDAGAGGKLPKRGDLKEMYSLGPAEPLSGMPARRWPPVMPASFQPAWEAYYDAVGGLGAQLLSGFALALGLEEDWFADKVTHHQCALRALNYPDLAGEAPAPGQLRASAHTDYGALTILRSGGPGLQVKKDVEGAQWHDVPFVPGAFVVNLGDLMRRWTNERWASTLHRVVNPPAGSDWGRRQSMAFFYNLNADAVVEAIEGTGEPKYEPITAGEFLLKKHLASMKAMEEAQAQAQA